MWGVEPNTLGLIVVGLMNLATLYYTRRTEKNTNSMKDALVARTAESSHAAGRDEMRVESEATAALVAEGVKQATTANNNGNIPTGRPLPVADSRTATATERTATASERIAVAAETASAKKP